MKSYTRTLSVEITVEADGKAYFCFCEDETGDSIEYCVNVKSRSMTDDYDRDLVGQELIGWAELTFEGMEEEEDEEVNKA